MVSPGAPHGITDTHREQLNADLLPFVQGTVEGSTSPRCRSRLRSRKEAAMAIRQAVRVTLNEFSAK